jgi:predicted nucleic acid-binding protein
MSCCTRSRAPAEFGKRDRARELLDRDDGALSVQVSQEFYVQATRAGRPDPLPREVAVGLMRTWTRFRVRDTRLALVAAALDIKAARRLSHWDSAIVAAARMLGRDVLYSEDMNDGQVIDGARITNPFQ